MNKLLLSIWFFLLLVTDIAFMFAGLKEQFELVVVNNLLFIATLIAFPPRNET